MISFKVLAVMVLASASIASQAVTDVPKTSDSSMAPKRQYAIAIEKAPAAPGSSYAYLTEDISEGRVKVSQHNESISRVADKSGEETSALAVCAVGVLIAAFTIMRRIN